MAAETIAGEGTLNPVVGQGANAALETPKRRNVFSN